MASAVQLASIGVAPLGDGLRSVAVIRPSSWNGARNYVQAVLATGRGDSVKTRLACGTNLRPVVSVY